jgi:hypothetical protein
VVLELNLQTIPEEEVVVLVVPVVLHHQLLVELVELVFKFHQHLEILVLLQVIHQIHNLL